MYHARTSVDQAGTAELSFEVTVDVLPEGELTKDIINTAVVDGTDPTDPVDRKSKQSRCKRRKNISSTKWRNCRSRRRNNIHNNSKK